MITVVALAASGATARAATSPTLGLHWNGPSGRGYGDVTPPTIFNGGDPTGLVDHIRWSGWGGARATGHGIGLWVWPGRSVAEGTRLPATVVAYDLGTCGGHPAYRKVTWYFPERGDRFDPDQWINACTGGYPPDHVPKCPSVVMRAPPGVATDVLAAGISCTDARRIIYRSPAMRYVRGGGKFRFDGLYCGSFGYGESGRPPAAFSCGYGAAQISWLAGPGGSHTPPPPPTGPVKPVKPVKPPEERKAKCMDVPVIGRLRITGDCFRITRDKAGYKLVLEAGKSVNISGLQITVPKGSELEMTVGAGVTKDKIGTFVKRIEAEKGVELSIGSVRLGTQKIDWPFASEADEGDGHGVGTGPDSEVKGLKLDGNVSIGFEDEGTLTATGNVSLGGELGKVTGEVTLKSSNPGGLKLGDLSVALGDTKIPLGPLKLQSASIKYADPDKWTGSAQVQLPGELPGEGAQVSGMLTLLVNRHGAHFSSLGLDANNLNVPIGPEGVFLQEIGGSLAIHPLVIKATAGLTAGPELAFGGDTYRLLSLTNTLSYSNADNANRYALNGTATALKDISLGQFDAAFVPGQGFAAAGQLGYAFGPVGVDARIGGWIAHGQFAFDGDGRVALPLLDAQGHLVISTNGIGACASAAVLWHTFQAGLAYGWGGSFNVFTGCNLAPYEIPAPPGVPQPTPPGAVRGDAAGARAVKLPASRRATMVVLHGERAAPAVQVTGPGGQTLTPGVQGAAYDPRFGYLLESPAQRSTFVIVAPHPRASTYTFNQLGTAPISAIRLRPTLPEPQVKASVSGHTITFRARRIAGQRLQFIEQGGGVGRAIATTGATRGRIRFIPHLGRNATRAIRVIVLEHGLPRAQLTVARYRYRYQRPLRPEHLRVARHGRPIVVGWRRRGPSTGFDVTLWTSSGQRLLQDAGPAAHGVTFRGVRGRVTRAAVVAIGLRGENSRAATVVRHPPHRRHRRRG